MFTILSPFNQTSLKLSGYDLSPMMIQRADCTGTGLRNYCFHITSHLPTIIRTVAVLLIWHRIVIIVVQIYTAEWVVVGFNVRVVPLQPIINNCYCDVASGHTKLPNISHIQMHMR